MLKNVEVLLEIKLKDSAFLSSYERNRKKIINQFGE